MLKTLQTCSECLAEFGVANDFEEGEVFTCPDCGMDYVIETDEKGKKVLKELILEGEDWGE
jgi:DNA-directed RNA polymerase subunit RPC12/RpoP